MTPEQFRAAGRALYGPNWTTAQFARDLLDTNPKTLSRWKAGEQVPDWAVLEIGVMLRERRAWIDEVLETPWRTDV